MGEYTHTDINDVSEVKWDDCHICDGLGKYVPTIDFLKEKNIWNHLDDFMEVYNLMKKGKWHWWRAVNCKYIDLRIDMRSGGCLIRDDSGERILPSELRHQCDS